MGANFIELESQSGLSWEGPSSSSNPSSWDYDDSLRDSIPRKQTFR